MANYIEEAFHTDLPRRRKVNIDPSIAFGLEIENNGFRTYKSLNDAKRIISDVDKNLELSEDRSLTFINNDKTIEHGIEIVTPVLHNKKEDIEMLKDLSTQLKHINPRYNLSSFQVNLDDNFTEEERLYLLKLYTLYEPIIARFCRGNDPILRQGVDTFANAIYYKIMNETPHFYDLRKILQDFTENKMVALNLKLRPKRLIEFRLPNGTNEYTLWFNYINMFANLLNAVKEKRIDEKYLDLLLQREKEHYNTNYKYQYKNFKIKEELLNDFLNTIFDNDEDRLYFTKQYIGDEVELKKAL